MDFVGAEKGNGMGKIRQLRKDGTLGEVESFGFVSAEAIKQYISRDHEGILFTCGHSYRRPATMNKPLSYEEAIATLDRYEGWWLEATHDGDVLSVTALDSNDMW